jgi:hypothetical protein
MQLRKCSINHALRSNTWDNIDRRAFMKKSTATVAGTVGLAKLRMAGTEISFNPLPDFALYNIHDGGLLEHIKKK